MKRPCYLTLAVSPVSDNPQLSQRDSLRLRLELVQAGKMYRQLAQNHAAQAKQLDDALSRLRGENLLRRAARRLALPQDVVLELVMDWFYNSMCESKREDLLQKAEEIVQGRRKGTK